MTSPSHSHPPPQEKLLSDFITVEQAAKMLGLSPPRIRQFLSAGRISAAQKIGGIWLIPRFAIDNFAKIARNSGIHLS